jgi:2-polyprenyl-6-methoxyphenol hydroxylase-like FAD-dependent oxidoreductase
MTVEEGRVDCCIVGCGPAGAILGLILARAGLDVTVLEKHQDFFRDFRGDAIHPPTLGVLEELGLIDRYFELPVERDLAIKIVTNEGVLPLADFANRKAKYPYVTYVPQWDFLNLLTDEAKRYPNFRLLMQAEGVDLLTSEGAIRGVRYQTPDGLRELTATLTVAADGRRSRMRTCAGLVPKDFGAAMDLLWFRVSRVATDPKETFVRLAPGYVFAMVQRGSYWQVGYVVPKGTYQKLRAHEVGALRTILRHALPFLGSRVEELKSWDLVGFLEVQVNRLTKWHRPGFLCLGDAAHASSPVAGFGVNMAVHDAVAAANAVAGPLLRGRVTERDLARVKRRRQLPTILTQAVQRLVQRDIVEVPDLLDPQRLAALPSTLDLDNEVDLPLPLVTRIFRRLTGRIITAGLRSEHIRV